METRVTDRSSEEQLFSRIAWRLVPLLIAIFLVAYIDRANIGFAKLQMLSSLKMSEASYGFASSLFFIGYLVCEVPSNLLMHRFGARRWISRIMFTWGVATLLLAWTPSALAFQILRFLLGAAEAGLYPGIVLYLGMRFPGRQRTGIKVRSAASAQRDRPPSTDRHRRSRGNFLITLSAALRIAYLP